MIGYIISGATALLAWGLSKVAKVNQLSNRLNIECTGRIHKITFTKITAAIKAKMKNPTNTSITIQHPYVELFYKGELIGSSDVKNETIPIPKYGQPETEMLVEISLLKLTVIAADMFRAMQTKQGTTTVQGKAYTSLVISENSRVELPPYEFTITL
jgi:hypothetical protein